MNELIQLLQMLSDDQLTSTQASLIDFNEAAERSVDLLKQMTQAANEAAAALQSVIALQSKS